VNYKYGSSLDDAREKLRYDLYYLKNRNLFLDFVVLSQTLRIVVSGEGAH
jgi:lipopolysaccharide/colanic/teichoic acid biosynthesis glycosyltransferase